MAAALVASTVLLTGGVARASNGPAGPPGNVRVTPPGQADDQQPSIALDPAHPGALAIAYMEGSRQRCGLALTADSGAHWSTRWLFGPGGEFPVPEGFGACWNPSADYGPDGILYYLFQTTLSGPDPYSHVMIAVSTDGGRSFASPHLVDPSVPGHVAGDRGGGDWWPSMAVDSRSRAIYVVWARFQPLSGLYSSTVMEATSVDRSTSFSSPRAVSPPDQPVIASPSVSVGLDATVTVAWLDLTDWERTSDQCQGGECDVYYFAPTDVQKELAAFYAQEGSRLDFTEGVGCEEIDGPYRAHPPGDPEPQLFPVQVSLGGNCAPAYLDAATSKDMGRTFALRGPIGFGVDLGCHPEKISRRLNGHSHSGNCDALHFSFYDHNVSTSASGPDPGEVLIASWQTGYPAGVPARIWLSRSFNDGVNWNSGIVGTISGHPQDSQHRPALAIAPGGGVEMAYYDSAINGTQQVYLESFPSGDRSPSLRKMSSEGSNPSVGPRTDENHVSFGDHLAITASSTTAFVAWTDTRSPAAHQSIWFAAAPVSASHQQISAQMTVSFLGLGAILLTGGALLLRRRRAAAKLTKKGLLAPLPAA